MPVGVVKAQVDNPVYLPFWRIRADTGSLGLSSYADLAKLVNLPAAPKKEWPTTDLLFWAPAFKISPFQEKGHELIHPNGSLAINKNTLRFGRSL